MRELGIGRPIPRSEDIRLIQGRGRYTNDFTLPGECHMAVVRSPHAHAIIRGIDAAAALEAPGAIAVLTGEDAASDGLGSIQTMVPRHKRNGSPMEKPPYPILAVGRVRLAGDAVAVVLAETLAQARDAAELVAVEYEELPAVTDAAEAVKPGAPVLWPELVPDNVAFVFQQGDREATDRAIANVAVSGIAGYLMDEGSHTKGPVDCPNYYNPKRKLEILTGRQKFCKACVTMTFGRNEDIVCSVQPYG